MGQNTVLETIKSQVTENDVVLYMKGTKEMPQCGFSSAVSKLLTDLQLPYLAVNVLDSPDLREGIKEFTDWPTILSSTSRGSSSAATTLFGRPTRPASLQTF